VWSGLWHKTLVTKGVGVSGTYVVLKFFAVRIYVDGVTRVTDNWILGFWNSSCTKFFGWNSSCTKQSNRVWWKRKHNSNGE
jgi:hypothetical protein